MAASHRHEQKRHGRHQKHTRNFLKVYTPYLPLLMIVIIGLVFSVISPPRSSKSVMSYATSMSIDQLLASTNQDRAANHLPALRLNSKLNSAAQSKANDMVTRNYWSHVTPTGQQPWVFITNAGYKYQAAAENLAYGFSTSADTIQGWMNSPEHRANMLNGVYQDVGFGFKNSSNYVGTGQETVIVAEYGEPVSTPQPAATASVSSKPAAASPIASQAAKSTVPTTDKTVVPAASQKAPSNTPSTIQTASAQEPPTQSVSRASQVTGVDYTWLASTFLTIALLGVISLLLRHAYGLNKWLRKGERYVLSHFVFDLTVVSLVVLCVFASQSIGFIK